MGNLLEQPQQRTQEWKDARVGVFTASECWKLMTPPRSKSAEFSDTAYTYILDKAAEQITGYSKDFVNEAMVWGIQMEPKAAFAYSLETGRMVAESPFIKMPDLNFGGSPDGLCLDRGLEIKCPYSTTKAIEYYLMETSEDLLETAKDYWWQVQSCMLVTDMPLWDFIVFDPYLYERIGLKVLTIEADKEAQGRLLEAVAKADAKLKEIVTKLSKKS